LRERRPSQRPTASGPRPIERVGACAATRRALQCPRRAAWACLSSLAASPGPARETRWGRDGTSSCRSPRGDGCPGACVDCSWRSRPSVRSLRTTARNQSLPGGAFIEPLATPRRSATRRIGRDSVGAAWKNERRGRRSSGTGGSGGRRLSRQGPRLEVSMPRLRRPPWSESKARGRSH
jgi:hypothetical protein